MTQGFRAEQGDILSSVVEVRHSGLLIALFNVPVSDGVTSTITSLPLIVGQKMPAPISQLSTSKT
jgi:hypothetical protein